MYRHARLVAAATLAGYQITRTVTLLPEPHPWCIPLILLPVDAAGAAQAVSLDPTYARGYAVLGVWYIYIYIYTRQSTLAHKELERALELAPGNAEILAMVAEQLPYLGHSERAVALFERARRLDPSSFYKDVEWQVYFFARKFRESAAIYR